MSWSAPGVLDIDSPFHHVTFLQMVCLSLRMHILWLLALGADSMMTARCFLLVLARTGCAGASAMSADSRAHAPRTLRAPRQAPGGHASLALSS